eukprot:11918911-Alexandrium_andersonii.AAC.1
MSADRNSALDEEAKSFGSLPGENGAMKIAKKPSGSGFFSVGDRQFKTVFATAKSYVLEYINNKWVLFVNVQASDLFD